MTDVRDEAAAAARPEQRANTDSGFIWYELMTPDPAGAKAFYDAVVGWSIDAESDFPNGYRMIGRSDGKAAGGLLPLTDEMQRHGARPAWLGYLYVEDVDASVAAIERDGGKALMPPFDIPNIGRVAMVTDPQGAAFYIMKPTPPAGQPEAQSDVFSPTEVQRCAWNELLTTDLVRQPECGVLVGDLARERHPLDAGVLRLLGDRVHDLVVDRRADDRGDLLALDPGPDGVHLLVLVGTGVVDEQRVAHLLRLGLGEAEQVLDHRRRRGVREADTDRLLRVRVAGRVRPGGRPAGGQREREERHCDEGHRAANAAGPSRVGRGN